MQRRSRSAVLPEWPPTLQQVIHAAELECPRGHGKALRDFSALAFRKVPARGIFDPAARGEHELFAAIESVAQTHLELSQAKAGWRAALDAAALDFGRRDAIEGAALQVQTVSDTAYFYAGLAFGLVAMCMYRSR
jgi:hypothetical protein